MKTGNRTRSLRGAMIGYGFIAGKGHAPGYVRCRERGFDVDICAIADISPASRERASVANPGAKLYDDYRRLLDDWGQRLDFVDIAVPPALHAEIADAALERGLHVLCEKPLTTNLADALRLARHAAEQKKVLFPGHNYRHAPVVKAVRELTQSGLIGEVTSITQQTFRPTHARGVAGFKPDWRREAALAGGGILMDHGSHTLYLAFEWMGGYPETISSRCYYLDKLDTEDNVACSMVFPRGVAHATLSWTAGTRKVIYTLHGSKGTVMIDNDVATVMLRDPKAALPPSLAATQGVIATESHWDDASHREWFADMFELFVSSIDRGEYVGKDARDAVQCINTIMSAYESARNLGREVRVRSLEELIPSAILLGQSSAA